MFELTVGEYGDEKHIGEYETRDQALIALGQYALEHGDAQFLCPHINEI